MSDPILSNPVFQGLMDKIAQTDKPMDLFKNDWARLGDAMELLPRRIEFGSREEVARTLVSAQDAARGISSACAILLRRYDPESERALDRCGISKEEAEEAMSNPPQP